MFDLRIWIAAIIGALIVGAGGAWVVRGWQKDAGHATELAALTKDKHALELTLEKQSGDIRALSAAASAAAVAGERAKADADSWRRDSQRKADQIKRLQASTCAELLEKSWGS